MKWCVSLAIFLSALLLSVYAEGPEAKPSPSPSAASTPKASSKEKSKDKSKKDGSKDKGKSKSGDKGKSKDKDSKDKDGQKKGKDEIVIPIEKGHQYSGISFPIFDTEGRLQMKFSIDAAERLDKNRLQMKNVEIETYTDTGEVESNITTENSVLNVETRMVTTTTPVTVTRSDFEVTGDIMEFDTRTHQGKFTGNTHMFIYKKTEAEDAATSHE